VLIQSPAARARAAEPLIIDLDATLVTSHSDKENVAGTYKGGYGSAPFVASCDYGTGNGTGEVLAALLRPGNTGANSADDHIRVFDAATAQLPGTFFDTAGNLLGEKILVRTDSAGASRKFLWHLHAHGGQFSVSYPVPVGKAHMIEWINDKKYWQPALDQDGKDRDGAWIPLSDYPTGTKLLLRRIAPVPVHAGGPHRGYRIRSVSLQPNPTHLPWRLIGLGKQGLHFATLQHCAQHRRPLSFIRISRLCSPAPNMGYPPKHYCINHTMM
jgi:hypothetical protein